MKYLAVPIQHFFDFNNEIQAVDSFATEHVKVWIEHLHESGLKSNTINQYNNAIKAFFNFSLETTEGENSK